MVILDNKRNVKSKIILSKCLVEFCLVYDIAIQVTKYTTGIKLMFQIIHHQEKSKSIKGHGLT